MSDSSEPAARIARIADGRTDLVFDHVAAGDAAGDRDAGGVALIRWCAYYGDVSAVRLLVQHGETLQSLGPNLDLNGAAFHGHWQLCQFLLEHGARTDHALPDSDETPLHAAVSGHDPDAMDHVVRVLLAHGADPARTTRPGAETGSFMRDCRTRGETALHRAAAFAGPETIRQLLDAGASREARDAHGDSPLGWASWYRRPDAVLRLLLYGDHAIHPRRRSMRSNLLGRPHPEDPA